jgi:hypothetical protein
MITSWPIEVFPFSGLMVLRLTAPAIAKPYNVPAGPFVTSTFPIEPKSISSNVVIPSASVNGIPLR